MSAECGVFVASLDIVTDGNVDWETGVPTQEECWDLCEANAACNAVSYRQSGGHCYMKAIAEDKASRYHGSYDSKRRCEPGKFVPIVNACALTIGQLLLLFCLVGECRNSSRSSSEEHCDKRWDRFAHTSSAPLRIQMCGQCPFNSFDRSLYCAL